MKVSDVISRSVVLFVIMTLAMTISVRTQDVPVIKSPPFPEHGNFWSLQQPNLPPLPFNRFPGLPLLVVSNGFYVVDDRDIDFDEFYKQAEADRKALGLDDEGGGSEPLGPMEFGPDDLWIEIQAVTNDYAYLTLHGTVEDGHYQLLYTTALTSNENAWAWGEIIVGAGGTNQTDFSPFFIGTNATHLFRAHHAEATIQIVAIQDALEPNALHATGQDGVFVLYNMLGGPALTVHYSVSGSATPGTDYTALSGQITMPATGSTYLNVTPASDSLVEGVESFEVSIVPDDNYLIEPLASLPAVIGIRDWFVDVRLSADPDAIEPDGPPGVPALTSTFIVERSDGSSQFPV